MLDTVFIYPSPLCPQKLYSKDQYIFTHNLQKILVFLKVSMIFSFWDEKIEPKLKNIKNIFWSVHLSINYLILRNLFSFLNI